MWTRRAIHATLVGSACSLLMTESSAAVPPRHKIVSFQTSPFPYEGNVPDTGRPFLDVQQGAQRGHTSPRGGVYLQDKTYSDRSVLLAISPRFSPSSAALVVFLHGNLARLERDVVGRQRVVAQFAASGLNAALVSPQFAVDALDSSAGHFWEQGAFARFLDEAAGYLAALSGHDRAAFASLPVVLVAYSGGYNPAAAILTQGGANDRIAGVILLDALYAEAPTFADWIVRSNGRGFFFSAFSPSSAPGNLALESDLRSRGIAFTEGLPAYLGRGTVAFLSTGPVVHNDFVTHAWVADPLRAILARVAI